MIVDISYDVQTCWKPGEWTTAYGKKTLAEALRLAECYVTRETRKVVPGVRVVKTDGKELVRLVQDYRLKGKSP